MSDPATCSECGAALPADAPGGACPQCLLGAGLVDRAEAESGAPGPEEIGRLFPGLEIEELLGQGGMGLVYRARQVSLDRQIALKIVPPDVAAGPGFADRFSREARTMARLDHPHIVRVHDFGETEGLYWLLMEYVDGPNLRKVMETGGLEPRQALTIVPQICDALQYAHDEGVVHRDIKPENVLLDRAGRVKLTDFGLAKLLSREGDRRLTRTDQIMGTPHYMAPEQIRDPLSVDHRADIYSLGVVFYEMLTGELPIGRFDPPSRRVEVDVRLDEVVLRALEHEPGRRYQKASEVSTRVDFLARTPAAAAPPPAPAPPSPAKPRTSRLAVVGFLMSPLALLVGVLLLALAGTGPGPTWSAIAVLPFTVLLFALGFVLSLVAAVLIVSSGGRLRGIGFAVAGTILPPIVGVLLVGFVFILHDAPPEPPERSIPIKPLVSSEPVAPGPIPVPVTGGPPGTDEAARQRVRSQVTGLWNAFSSLTRSEEVRPVLPGTWYAPDDWARIELLPEERRLELGREGHLGLPLFTGETGGPPLHLLRVSSIDLAPDGRSAVAHVRAGDRFLVYGVRSERNGWFFDVAPVLRLDAPLSWDAYEPNLVHALAGVVIEAIRAGPADEVVRRFVSPALCARLGRDPALPSVEEGTHREIRIVREDGRLWLAPEEGR